MPDERVLSIVNIASIAGHSPVPLGSLYSMSKAALISLTKAIAKEYGQHGVRCNSVSPVSSELSVFIGMSFEAGTIRQLSADAQGNMMVPNVEGISAEVCITWICRMLPTAESQDLVKVHQSIPLARGGEPSEIAGIVAWLASDDSSFTTGSDFLSPSSPDPLFSTPTSDVQSTEATLPERLVHDSCRYMHAHQMRDRPLQARC